MWSSSQGLGAVLLSWLRSLPWHKGESCPQVPVSLAAGWPRHAALQLPRVMSTSPGTYHHQHHPHPAAAEGMPTLLQPKVLLHVLPPPRVPSHIQPPAGLNSTPYHSLGTTSSPSTALWLSKPREASPGGGCGKLFNYIELWSPATNPPEMSPLGAAQRLSAPLIVLSSEHPQLPLDGLTWELLRGFLPLSLHTTFCPWQQPSG